MGSGILGIEFRTFESGFRISGLVFGVRVMGLGFWKCLGIRLVGFRVFGITLRQASWLQKRSGVPCSRTGKLNPNARPYTLEGLVFRVPL